MTRRKRNQRRQRDRSRVSAELPTDCWVEFGGQRIWAVDWTSGGFPIGLTEEQMADCENDDGDRSRIEVRSVLKRAFHDLAPNAAKLRIRRSTRIGGGFSREQYAADVALDPDPRQLSGTYVVGLPLPFGDQDSCARLAREMAVLSVLRDFDLPFRIPRPLYTQRVSEGVVSVRSFLTGIELDLRAGRQPGIRPWLVVGEIAAAIHRLEATRLREILLQPADGSHFARARLDSLAIAAAHPLVERAIGWAESNIPGRSTAFIHGDLLGQNILLDPREPAAVIDWEYSGFGDPAYDLAIVTRGARRPFQVADGFERLLDAYSAAGGNDIRADAVQFYEVCLVAGWVRDAVVSGDQSEQEHYSVPLASLLKRLGA